ncbi:hypothetical protein XELAEV_18042920mg [Xenopus laevis]|nr:hypothetical protein XELAEV_18042920mg [Xenopus laevis]
MRKLVRTVVINDEDGDDEDDDDMAHHHHHHHDGQNSSGDPGEYNLRSRTVCTSCGRPADKGFVAPQGSGLVTGTSGSSSSSVTVTRTYRGTGGTSGGSGLGESLGTRTFIVGNDQRAQVTPQNCSIM